MVWLELYHASIVFCFPFAQKGCLAISVHVPTVRLEVVIVRNPTVRAQLILHLARLSHTKHMSLVAKIYSSTRFSAKKRTSPRKLPQKRTKFSRMPRRRVPVLKLGSRGPGGDQKSLRLCPQAFASVRKRPRVSRVIGSWKSNCRHCLRLAFQKCQQSQGSGGRGREMQNCRHFWTRVVSSLLESATSHRDRGGRGRETQNSRHFWSRVGFSLLKSVNSHRDQGGRRRETQNSRHFWTRVGSSLRESVNSHRDRGGRGRETQNSRRFWTCARSSRLKSVKSHRDRGVVVAKRIESANSHRDRGRSSSRNAEEKREERGEE